MADLRVLYFVEGFTDIRFVVGLSRICSLTMAVPAREYALSGLKERVSHSCTRVSVSEIAGGRIGFQWDSLRYLWRVARQFDVILAQEVLRGALNANLIGMMRHVPVVTYMGISPIEYFRCRRQRGQIGWLKSFGGETLVRMLMSANGYMATKCLAMGPYLRDVAARYCTRSEIGLYYGVDTEFFRPADAAERIALRRKRDLPLDKFLVFLPSRISHEKDPETVLRAVSLARQRGLNAVLLNLGGGYEDFLNLARQLSLPDPQTWVMGRAAVHPMTDVADYFRAADVVALASLAEGAAFSTLESLAAGTPVIATAVGGMAVQLRGYARLTPLRDPQAMAEEILWVASNPEAARAQAMQGRAYVLSEWSRDKAFADLRRVLEQVAKEDARWR
ncbi:MAG TPA: glycosyltransferase family 4 protein [Candidatus Binataceae bacterium]|nr:glycosyltransferase family 4 protein [Candidatus Binataceae bacterium]